MNNTIILNGIKGDICLNPFLLNKNTLGFKTNDIPGFSLNVGNIILNEKYKGVELKANSKKFLMKMDEDIFNQAMDFKSKEKSYFKSYFNRLKSGDEEIISYISDDNVYDTKTKSSWDKGYTPYWDKIFRHLVETKTNGLYINNDNEGEFQEFLSEKISKAVNLRQVKVVSDGGDRYIKMTFNEIIEYLIAE